MMEGEDERRERLLLRRSRPMGANKSVHGRKTKSRLDPPFNLSHLFVIRASASRGCLRRFLSIFDSTFLC
jgi:hypothetical protein